MISFLNSFKLSFFIFTLTCIVSLNSDLKYFEFSKYLYDVSSIFKEISKTLCHLSMALFVFGISNDRFVQKSHILIGYLSNESSKPIYVEKNNIILSLHNMETPRCLTIRNMYYELPLL